MAIDFKQLEIPNSPYTADYLKGAYEGLVKNQFTPVLAEKEIRDFAARNRPTINFSNGSTSNISQGSDAVRDKITGVKTDSYNLDKDITNTQTQYTINSLKEALGQRDVNAPLSAEEQARVDAAGAGAAEEFRPLIESATEAKRKGVPKAIVGAGERGGFLSTQYAGAAALVPTEGGSFVGAGGELSNIASEYDKNITDLQAKQQQAIALAKSKAQEAIRTGKEQSNKEARELFKLAQDANEQILDMQKKKIDLVSSYRKEGEARVESSIGALVSGLTGDTLNDQQLIQDAADQFGVSPNVVITQIQQYSDKKNKEALDAVSKKVDIAKDIPLGETYTDPDSGLTFIGTKRPDEQEVTQTVGGNEIKIVYDVSDPANPKELRRFNLGPRWKTNGTGNDGKTNVNAAILQAVDYLNGLKQSGAFNDMTYQATVDALISQFPKDFTLGDEGAIKSLLNERLQRVEQAPTIMGSTKTTAEAPTSKIEQDIARLKKGGVLTDADIRFTLRKNYPDKEVSGSSVGSFGGKAAEAGSKIISGIGKILGQ